MTPRERHLLRKFGITDAQYNELLRKQELCCGVCRRSHLEFRTRLCVDHDHKTGEIRGLLCTHCNRYVIGRHRAPDGIRLFENASQYLTGGTGWFVPPKKKKRRKARK